MRGAELLAEMKETPELRAPEGNTTLVCVCTDAALDKRECGMVARAATAGIARAVDPTFTPVDGDVAFCLASGLPPDRASSVPSPRCRSGGRRGDGRRRRHPRRGQPGRRSLPVRAMRQLGRCRDRSRPRRWCCAASATARPTASSTSTPPRGAGSARSRRGRAGRSRASAAGWSRSSGSTSSSTRAGATSPTVTGASTLDGYARLRADGAALRAAGARLRRGAAPAGHQRGQPGRLQPALQLPVPARRRPPIARQPGPALAFRLKLALAAGFAPELASCASCGEADHLTAFSGAAGGVVCASCEGGGFPLSEESHRFMVEALARPLAEAPAAEGQVPAQSDRAVTETLEHHAHVQLRAAA